MAHRLPEPRTGIRESPLEEGHCSTDHDALIEPTLGPNLVSKDEESPSRSMEFLLATVYTVSARIEGSRTAPAGLFVGDVDVGRVEWQFNRARSTLYFSPKQTMVCTSSPRNVHQLKVTVP